MGSQDVPATAGGSRGPQRLVLGAAAVLLVLGLALHLAYFATVGPLWRDEVHEVNFASLGTLPEMLGRLWLDSSPALYKLFLRGWSHLGDGDRTYRLSGLVLAVAYAGVLCFFFGRPWRRGAPVLALSLPVLSLVVVRQFDALRPYGLGVLLTTLFFAAFLRFFRHAGARAYWLAAAAGILAVNATYHACFFILAACLGGAVVALATNRSRRRAAALLSLGAWPLLGVLPYVAVVERSSSWIVTQQTEVPFAAVLGIFRQAAGPAIELAALAVAVAGLVLLVARIAGRRTAGEGEAPEGPLGLVVVILFSILILGSFHASGIPPTPHRYVPLLMMSALCLDVTLRAQPLRWRAGVAVVVALVALAAFPAALDRVTTRQSNVDLIADRIERLAAPEDIVLLRSWTSAISFHRYYDGPAAVWTIPNVEDHRVHRYDLLRRKLEDEEPDADVIAAVERTLRGGHRVFLAGNFRSVRADQEIPRLAPAPHPRHGWYKVAYLWNWEDRVTQFVLRHATRVADATPATTQEIDPHERLPLRVAAGWREWDEAGTGEGDPTMMRSSTVPEASR